VTSWSCHWLLSGSAKDARLKYERRSGSRPGTGPLSGSRCQISLTSTPVADQLVACDVDVIDDQQQALQRLGHRRQPLAELDRRRGARRGELHPAGVLGGLEVDVETPSEALVEGLGTVDVGDR
jgi:hypothetical protein